MPVLDVGYRKWNGERTKLIYAFPTNEKLWQDYAEVRADCLRQGRGGVDTTRFYELNRAEMDAGAKVAWEARTTRTRSRRSSMP